MDYDQSRLRRLIAEWLSQTRKRRGWSQEWVAQGSGIKTQALGNIEKAKASLRLLYLCQMFLDSFDFDLKDFIINNLLDQPKGIDFNNTLWRNEPLINLFYRQVRHDQLDYLIHDQLKANQASKLKTLNRTWRQLNLMNQMRGKQMDRRSTLLGLTSGIVSGPALTDNLGAYLQAFDKNTPQGEKNLAQAMGKLGLDEVESLKQAAHSLYESRIRYGGGPNRRIAIALLHEVYVAAKEKQAAKIQISLYNIMADLAETVAKMSWHDGLERSAQQYFQLALRAAQAGQDKLFSARVLSNLAWQMYHLGKAEDALNLIHLAQNSTQGIAGPQVKMMMYSYEAWAFAALGQSNEFEHAISLAQNNIGHGNNTEEPDWVRHYAEGHVLGMAGGGLRMLALHKPKKYAEQSSEVNAKAIALREQKIHSYTAQDYIGLAEVRFLLKDTELAIAATENAIAIHQQLQHRCGSTRRRLQDIYQYTNQATKSIKLQALNVKLKSILSVV